MIRALLDAVSQHIRQTGLYVFPIIDFHAGFQGFTSRDGKSFTLSNVDLHKERHSIHLFRCAFEACSEDNKRFTDAVFHGVAPEEIFLHPIQCKDCEKSSIIRQIMRT